MPTDGPARPTRGPTPLNSPPRPSFLFNDHNLCQKKNRANLINEVLKHLLEQHTSKLQVVFVVYSCS